MTIEQPQLACTPLIAAMCVLSAWDAAQLPFVLLMTVLARLLIVAVQMTRCHQLTRGGYHAPQMETSMSPSRAGA